MLYIHIHRNISDSSLKLGFGKLKSRAKINMKQIVADKSACGKKNIGTKRIVLHWILVNVFWLIYLSISLLVKYKSVSIMSIMNLPIYQSIYNYIIICQYISIYLSLRNFPFKYKSISSYRLIYFSYKKRTYLTI